MPLRSLLRFPGRSSLVFMLGLAAGRFLRRQPAPRIRAEARAPGPWDGSDRVGRRTGDQTVTGVRVKLARSRDELRQLSAALQTIREQERTYIARELHDDLGQLLAALRMDLTLLQQTDGNNAHKLALMEAMQSNLATAIVSLRRIATNLRPRALDEGGLYFALQGLCNDFSQRYGIACVLYADETELQLDDAASTAVFRIIQEALTNIARHADATQVTVNAYRLDGELLLTVRDNGRGISGPDMEKAGSLGLVGMRERVWNMHGEIVVASDEPPGTHIDIVLPIRQHLL